MKKPTDHLDHERLIAAADAILAGPTPGAGDLPIDDPRRRAFTAEELVEAARFLARLGLVPPTTGHPRAA